MQKQRMTTEAFVLTGENMSEVTQRIAEELQQHGEREDCLRLRLAFEDILDQWQLVLGKDTLCTIRYGKRFGRWCVQLQAPGVVADPNLELSSTDNEAVGNVILQGLGLFPVFEYKGGVNYITLSLSKEKPNQLLYLMGAGVASVALGLLSLQAPSETQTLLTEQLAAPVLGVLVGMLSGVAIPMIFLSISISIVNMGNIAALGRIGKRFLIHFVAIVFAAPLVTLLLCLFTVTITAGGTDIGGFQTIFSMLIGAVPTNIIEPFLSGNILQIIFLGFCFGVALLVLNDRTRTLTDCMKQLQSVVTVFMDGINSLLPLLVFLTFYRLVASGSISKLGGVVKIVLMALVALVLFASCVTAFFCLRLRVPFRAVLRKTFPIFAVALSTASSMATFSMRVACCNKDLGVDKQVTSFAIPLAQALLKPETGIIYAIAALCVASAYGVAITPMWLVLCGLVAALLSIATPPVPGGGQMAYAALFLQLGIPAEGLMLALAAETILDFACTALSCHVQLLLITLTADTLGKVELKALRHTASPLRTPQGR